MSRGEIQYIGIIDHLKLEINYETLLRVTYGEKNSLVYEAIIKFLKKLLYPCFLCSD